MQARSMLSGAVAAGAKKTEEVWMTSTLLVFCRGKHMGGKHLLA